MHRKAGNEARARELIALAVDAHPSHAALRAFEAVLSAEPLSKIHWDKILLPPPQPKVDPMGETDAKNG